jgi:hypothetical protein
MATLSSLPQELLDAILQLLDMKTLLFAQRVSHTWRSIVTSSPQLQEALFLRPKTAQTPLYTCSWIGNNIYYFGPAKDKPDTNPNSTSKITTQIFTPVRITRLLADAIYCQSLDPRPDQVHGHRLNLQRLRAFLRHPSGSWRSMLLTQPPVSSILATSITIYDDKPECEFDEIKSANDADWDWDCTLGDLVDRMLAVCYRSEVAGSQAAARRLWTVKFSDTVGLGYLAVGNKTVRVVKGGLVFTGGESLGDANDLREIVAHPRPPFFR